MVVLVAAVIGSLLVVAGSGGGSNGWACGSRGRWWQCLIVMGCLVG